MEQQAPLYYNREARIFLLIQDGSPFIMLFNMSISISCKLKPSVFCTIMEVKLENSWLELQQIHVLINYFIVNSQQLR